MDKPHRAIYVFHEQIENAMKKYFFLSVFFLSSLLTIHAQPAFTIRDELRVSQSHVDGTPPAIAVNPEGAVWVTWGGAAQWLSADLHFIGNNDAYYRNTLHPFAISNQRWGIFHPARKCSDGIQVGCESNYRFLRIENHKVLDSTETLVSTYDFDNSRQEPGEYSSKAITNSSAYTSGDTLISFFSTNYDAISIGTHVLLRSHDVFSIQMATLKVIGNIQFDDSWYTGDHSFHFKRYGIPNRAISNVLNSKFLIMTRAQQAYGFPRTDTTSYHRSVQRYDMSGKAIGTSVFIDSLPPLAADLSEQIIWDSPARFAIFNRHISSDSIFIRFYDSSGIPLAKEKLLAAGVRTFPGVQGLHEGYGSLGGPIADSLQCFRRADVGMKLLDKNRYLLYWSGVERDSSTNVYIRLLDANMNWLGAPKRINSDPAGNQYTPCVAIKGDTVHVAWLDTRSGDRHVYMRRFTVDQITNVALNESPSRPVALECFPNPFSRETTIRYTLASPSHVKLSVFDLFGRNVATLVDGEMEAGEQELNFRQGHLDIGVYMYRLESESYSFLKTMIIL